MTIQRGKRVSESLMANRTISLLQRVDSLSCKYYANSCHRTPKYVQYTRDVIADAILVIIT